MTSWFEDTQFGHNGAGDGYSHNFYINHVRSFTLEGSWSHDANVGHLVKSRALTNYIRYNRITGQAGSDSYEIDLPNGGLSYVIGNVIQQGMATQNPNMLCVRRGGQPQPRLAACSSSTTLSSTTSVTGPRSRSGRRSPPAR